ncbi:MAG: low molecular weight phosphatase family protein [Thalassolituus sp.]|nr:MAG: low molecular weight phosphatase family protein [Thalassolituus sp.]
MKILFICTHNRCRSILAEALTRHISAGKIDARSAGSQPAGVVFPGTLTYLKSQNIPTDGLTSQSWDDHEAFAPDVVITVCDSAAGETCPVWFGQAARVHWGLPDPSKLPAETEQQEKFKEVGAMMQQRLALLASADLDSAMDKSSLEVAIKQLLVSEQTV